MQSSTITEITARNANLVFRQLLDCASQSIDLSQIQHCDSAGIAVLIEVKRQKRQKPTYLNPPKQLLALCRFLNVTALLFE